MRKTLTLILAVLALAFAAQAGNYKNFRNTAYVMAGDVNRIGTVENWEKSYAEFSRNLKLDKVYIETFRDMTYSDDKALEAAIKFFKSKGVEVSGGITYNWRGGVRQRWESFCYSNPEHLAIIQGVIERTAALFDEIVLDDYYFTNCKDDRCIEAGSAKRGVSEPTWGRVAQYAYDKIDPILGKLGNPKGIPAYKPFNAEGEEFLHNYLGMAGLPVEIVPEFPKEGKAVILTEAAAADRNILAKMNAFLRKGGDIVVTSGFYKAMQDKGIKGIFEMIVTDRKADVETVVVQGFGGGRYQTDVPIKIPVLTYFTNDSWELITTLDYGNGWPLLHHSVYSEGNIYVLTIPDNYSHLYAYPAPALNLIRKTASPGMDVYIEGPSQVSLFTYDNGTFVAHSFQDKPVEVSFVFKGKKLTDIGTGKKLDGTARPEIPVNGHPRTGAQETVVKVTIPPHSFRAFKID